MAFKASLLADFFFFPSQKGDLVALETLNLAYNMLSSLPSEMRNLRQLKYLGLEGNRDLRTLSLDLSRMTGTQIKVRFSSPHCKDTRMCESLTIYSLQMDGLLHVPGELESPLLILEYIENLNLLGLPVNLRSHWVRLM